MGNTVEVMYNSVLLNIFLKLCIHVLYTHVVYAYLYKILSNTLHELSIIHYFYSITHTCHVMYHSIYICNLSILIPVKLMTCTYYRITVVCGVQCVVCAKCSVWCACGTVCGTVAVPGYFQNSFSVCTLRVSYSMLVL